jgi:serine/threonine-protein kinase
VVKVPQAPLLQDAGFAQRFAHEVKSLVRLSHPHVIRVMDVGEHQGLPFCVLQHMPGGNLRTRHLGRSQRPQLAELRAWLPQVASALDFIHRQGAVHRDIQPDNILFDSEGNAYVSDFGIAKALAAGGPNTQTLFTGTGPILGTARYMAPELLLGQPCDGRADQFALAVLVYEALSGQVPFDGATPAAIHHQQKLRPPPLAQCVPQMPSDASAAVQRALHVEPAQRFPSCAALAGAVLGASRTTRAGSGPQPPTRAVAATPLDDATVVEKATVLCPHCRHKVGVRAKLQGKRAQCLNCKTAFQVPMLAQLAATQRVQAAGIYANEAALASGSGWWVRVGCAVLVLALLVAVGGWVYVANYGWPSLPWEETATGE